MTDRELLTFAAKAAGYTLTDHYDVEGRYWPWCHELVRHWCPLGDDGDALRLAVKLNLLIDCCGMCVRPIDDSFEWMDATGPDEFVNVRRAITLCAAEIGRRMG